MQIAVQSFGAFPLFLKIPTLGRVGNHLGGHLGAIGDHLGTIWSHVGAIWEFIWEVIWGPFGSHLEPFGSHLGGHLGAIWEAFPGALRRVRFAQFVSRFGAPFPEPEHNWKLAK